MATYHPLGFQRAVGARERYWICSHAGPEPIRFGGLLFAAAALKLQARDAWTGGIRRPGPGVGRGSPITADFSSCPGCRSPTSPVMFWTRSRGALGRTGQPATALHRCCSKPLSKCPGPAPAMPPPTGSAWGLLWVRGGRPFTIRSLCLGKTIWVYPLVRRWRSALVGALADGCAAEGGGLMGGTEARPLATVPGLYDQTLEPEFRSHTR